MIKQFTYRDAPWDGPPMKKRFDPVKERVCPACRYQVFEPKIKRDVLVVTDRGERKTVKKVLGPGYLCMSPEAPDNKEALVGALLGKVCWVCHGKWFEPK